MSNGVNDPLAPKHVAGIAVGGLLGLAGAGVVATLASPILVPLGLVGTAAVAMVPALGTALGVYWGHKATS